MFLKAKYSTANKTSHAYVKKNLPHKKIKPVIIGNSSNYVRAFYRYKCGSRAGQRKYLSRCLLQSLTMGYFDGSITVKKLKIHGDIGIETFERLNGELLNKDAEYIRDNSDEFTIK